MKRKEVQTELFCKATEGCEKDSNEDMVLEDRPIASLLGEKDNGQTNTSDSPETSD